STRAATTVAPSALSPSATACRVSSSRSKRTRRAPRCANLVAQALPIPLAAPVTTATLPPSGLTALLPGRSPCLGAQAPAGSSLVHATRSMERPPTVHREGGAGNEGGLAA